MSGQPLPPVPTDSQYLAKKNPSFFSFPELSKAIPSPSSSLRFLHLMPIEINMPNTKLPKRKLRKLKKRVPTKQDATPALDDRSPFSLLAIQRGLLAESLESETPGLNLEQVVAELDEVIDEDLMRTAWQHVMQAHEALQVGFNWDLPAHPTQQVKLDLVPPIVVIEAEGDSALEHVLSEERERGFDLDQPPLMRVVLLRYSAQRWAMVWTVHHLVIDRSSISVVLQQVFEAYETLVAGQPLASLQATSLKGLAHWEEQFDHSEGLDSIQRMLDGIKTSTSLPLYLNDDGQRSHCISDVHLEFPSELCEKMRQCAYEAEVSDTALIQLGWGILLQRYGAGKDLLFGGVWTTPRNGAFSDVVAPSTVKLPVRLQLESDQTVRNMLQSLHADHLALQKYRWTPLQDIQQIHNGGERLFETYVAYEHASFENELSQLAGWQQRKFWSRSHSRESLSLKVQETGDSLSLTLRYDTGLYDKETAAQLLDDYFHILTALIRQSDQPLRNLDVLSPAMRTQWVDPQCAREQTPPKDSTLVRILSQCESRPEALAIRALQQGLTVSYGELGQRVNRLARILRAEGVREGDIVAIHVSRSVEAIVSMLAIHAAGAAFLPLDLNSPADRRTYMLEDSQVRLMLMDGSATLDTPVQKLRVDQKFDDIADDALPDLPNSLTPPDGLAYVIYTSGSTGKPKGVCIEHGSLANHIVQMTKLFELSLDDRSVQFASLAFDASLEEVFTTLATGASLWLRDEEMATSARAFFDRVAENELSVISLTTAFWHQLVHSQMAWPDCVRLVVVGGERADPRMHAQFRQLVKDHVRFINAYGPTETTIACTCYDDAEGDHDLNVLPIGRPLGGVSCFVLDENLVPVPPQVEGQLYVGGAGVARGYLRRDELTTERFIAHPFRPNAGPRDRLYATGDIVRRTPKGNLIYVDRIDNQVKVQGYRVELGEIETCLRNYQGIEEAVVLPLSLPGGGGTRLVAFAQAAETEVDSNELRDFVRSELPAFMVPRQVEVLRTLPYTAVGKVDRQALIKRASELPKKEPIPGVDDPLQTQLLHIWSEILKVRVTDPSSDFFLLGGDSLMAVRLFTEIERELGMQCMPQEFFKNPTVEALAQTIREHDGTDFKAPLVKLAEGSADVLPLFVAPTVSGQVADYFHLADALGDSVPIYGLQMRGIRSGETIHDNLRDAARFYVERMREVQPEGPYRILGFSAGGVVSLAIAEVLHEQGEQTEFLGMMDSVPANIEIAAPFSSPRRMWRFGCTLVDRFRELLEGKNVVRNFFKRAVPALQRIWAHIWPSAKEPEIEVVALFERSGIVTGLTSEEANRMQAHLDTMTKFRAQGYPIDIVLIRSKYDPLEGPHQNNLGWDQAVTGNIQIESVPVRHYDMVAKGKLKPVAKMIRRYLTARGSQQS